MRCWLAEVANVRYVMPVGLVGRSKAYARIDKVPVGFTKVQRDSPFPIP